MILGISWVEWLGYLASIVIAVSLLMSSIVKLRWVNLAGSVLFSYYGFSIHALPVGIINAIICGIDIYYLIKIYTEKEYFKIIEVDEESKYLDAFLDYYKGDIKKYFPKFDPSALKEAMSFYILRDMVPAGVFIASKQSQDTLIVELDYVTPQYRDFKAGKYIYCEHESYFTKLGYKKLCTRSYSGEHDAYLRKMGFKEMQLQGSTMLVKELGKQ